MRSLKQKERNIHKERRRLLKELPPRNHVSGLFREPVTTSLRRLSPPGFGAIGFCLNLVWMPACPFLLVCWPVRSRWGGIACQAFEGGRAILPGAGRAFLNACSPSDEASGGPAGGLKDQFLNILFFEVR